MNSKQCRDLVAVAAVVVLDSIVESFMGIVFRSFGR